MKLKILGLLCFVFATSSFGANAITTDELGQCPGYYNTHADPDLNYSAMNNLKPYFMLVSAAEQQRVWNQLVQALESVQCGTAAVQAVNSVARQDVIIKVLKDHGLTPQ